MVGGNQAQQSAPSPPQVRHAGRAHVRGKYRRVWRPRYLELLDQGIVRYYEFPSNDHKNSNNHNTNKGPTLAALPSTTAATASSGMEDSWHYMMNANHNNNNNHNELLESVWPSNHHTNTNTNSAVDQQRPHEPAWIPKYILQISHARILDVTTLRDMHVGLPRGSYGFTFRGQRLPYLEQQYDSNNSSNNKNTNGTLSSDPAAAELSPNNNSNNNPSLPEPRDFLCAVDTLEDAQMWVVALQWAASERMVVESVSDYPLHHNNNNHRHDNNNNNGNLQHLSMSDATNGGYVHVTSPTTATTTVNTTTTNTEPPTPGVLQTAHPHIPTYIGEGGSTPSSEERVGSSSGGGGKMVVTKVVTVRPVRLSTWQWEVAYEIHVLLVSSATSTRRPHRRRRQMEEWIIFRTAHDLYELIHALHDQVQQIAASTAQDVLRCWKQPILDLPVLQQQQQQQQQSNNQNRHRNDSSKPCRHYSNHSTFHQALVQSIHTVDGILRSLVTDALMVRTQALKSFLGLELLEPAPSSSSSSSNTDSSFDTTTWIQRLWMIHNSQAVSDRRLLVADEPQSQAPSPPLDVSVKQWLQQSTMTPPSASLLTSSSSSFLSSLGGLFLLVGSSSSSSSSPTSSLVSSSPGGVSLWDSYTAFVLQRPWALVMGGMGISSVVVLWPLCQWACRTSESSSSSSGHFSSSSSSPWIPLVSLRADALVMTWMGAAYLGYQYRHHHHQQQQHHDIMEKRTDDKNASEKRKKNRKRPTSKDNSTTSILQQPQSTKQQPNDQDDDDDDDDGIEVIPPGSDEDDDEEEDVDVTDEDYESSDGETAAPLRPSLTAAAPSRTATSTTTQPSPLPKYPDNNGKTCWSEPPHHIFQVRSQSYLKDKVKEPSGPPPFTCRGIDVWMTDNPERCIARHPAVLGGKLPEEDTFLVNFLLPFGNFVAYFSIPPLSEFPPKVRTVWQQFLDGDQEYRDARLKLLPVVAEGPWIVKAAVGPGKTPAVLGKVIPLQYFFSKRDDNNKNSHNTDKNNKNSNNNTAAIYEVDVIITASSIAKGILSVVKGHTKNVSLAFAFIIEAVNDQELPETVLACCQVHQLHLEECPMLPPRPTSDNNSDDENEHDNE